MKVLVLNGSPRKDKSNTLVITKAFTEGFPADAEIEFVELYGRDIKPCLGCFSCWTKTPGSCVIKDDMQELYGKISAADVIIESFPLYFFGMPSQMKAMTDRCLAFMMPYLGDFSDGDKASFHELRDEAMHGKHFVVISTCGYVSEKPMFPALLKQLDLICGEGNYTAIMCPEGELFVSELAKRQRKALLDDARNAGAEYAEKFSLSAETKEKLARPLLSQKGFAAAADAHWGPGRKE